MTRLSSRIRAKVNRGKHRCKEIRLTDNIQIEFSTCSFAVVFIVSMAGVFAIVSFVDIVDRQLIASNDELRYFTCTHRGILEWHEIERDVYFGKRFRGNISHAGGRFHKSTRTHTHTHTCIEPVRVHIKNIQSKLHADRITFCCGWLISIRPLSSPLWCYWLIHHHSHAVFHLFQRFPWENDRAPWSDSKESVPVRQPEGK